MFTACSSIELLVFLIFCLLSVAESVILFRNHCRFIIFIIRLLLLYDKISGLSKESWLLTKLFVSEMFLLCLGFFTFHPTMQEFCLFAVVGLTTDFFLQLFFFVAILSVDIRRMEVMDLNIFHIEYINLMGIYLFVCGNNYCNGLLCMVQFVSTLQL